MEPVSEDPASSPKKAPRLRHAARKAKIHIILKARTAAQVSKQAASSSKHLSKRVVAKAKKHFSTFHALHSSLRMDRLDYVFKFSTELMVAGLTLAVAIIGLGGINRLQAMGNSTEFSQFALAHPTTTNKALYARATTSVAVVEHTDGGGLIQVASADVNPNSGNESPAPVGESAQISDNTITSPNPDTVKNLITDQIKVYVTQPGDTLSGIAAQFNLSPNTIIWANNLSSQTIKPGWDLVILPTDGVLHKVTANDTLPDIAKEFNANIDTIISYNNLADDDDINPGDLLIIPGGSVTPPPAAKPAAKPIANTVTTKKGKTVVVYEPAPGDITEIGGAEHSFPWGECTWYVAQRRNVPWGGNARDWLVNAKAYGAKEGKVPIVGAIMVSNESKYGHVALVQEVKGDQFEVAEMNYKGKGVVDYRWISMADSHVKGFIY